MPNFDVEPSPRRAVWLAERMQRQLCDSLGVLADCFPQEDFPEVESLSRFVATLKAGHTPSAIDYGRYYQLAAAALAADGAGARKALAGFAPEATVPLPLLTCWTDPPTSPLQMMATDRFGTVAQLFHAVDAATFNRFGRRFAEGMQVLEQCWPEMAGEVAALVRHVLVATGAASATEHFDGGSHYQLWGLLILNPAFHSTPLAMAEVLVHEASHLLLFGLTTDEPMVLNDDGALYASPLRKDPRPMDGLYHAAYVSARMALTMHKIAANTSLAPALRHDACRMRDDDIANFESGAAVVRQHARFSATGETVFSRAEQAITALKAEVAG